MTSSRTCIGVLFGGASREHNVSIKSAQTIVLALRSGINVNKFLVKPFYIDPNGQWMSSDISEKILQKGNAINSSSKLLNVSAFKCLPDGSEEIEVWFPVLHGPNGEDGTVQGLLKLTGKRFVGSDVMASAIGMDKIAMKAIFKEAGLPQLPYIAINSNEFQNELQLIKTIKDIEASLKYPIFIKPANLGSSIGITKAKNQKELNFGLIEAAKFDKRIVIEKGIAARELECAVLGIEPMQISKVGEIDFDSEWYDYDSKYLSSKSQAIIPAPIEKEISEQVQEMTLKACKAIDAKGLARVDFFYENQSRKLWLNEINTLPGFTRQSMYPMLWEATNISLQELVRQLVETAAE